MPRRRKIEKLPRELREWLDAELVRRGFSDYVKLAADLARESAARGAAAEVSKSGLQRYGKSFKEKLERIRASTQAATFLAQLAPDDADLRSASVLSMLQTEIFEVLLKLPEVAQVDAEKRAKILAAVAKAAAPLARASIHQKKHELEIRARVAAAAERIAARAKKGGASRETVEDIRREVLGIAA